MDVLRIRLEGAVELLETARADFESLEASLPRWEDELPLQRARLDARLAEEARLAESLARCAAHAELTSLVEEVRRRRAHVLALAKRELAAVAPGDASRTPLEALARLEALALAPVAPDGAAPLAAVTITARAPWPIGVLTVASVAALLWSPAVGLVGIVLALMLTSGLRRKTRYELLEDRVVVTPCGHRGYAVPLASVTALGPADEPGHLCIDGARRLLLPATESRRFVERVALRRARCFQGVAGAPGRGATVVSLQGTAPGPGTLLIGASGVTFLGEKAGRAALEALDGRPVGVEVPEALLAEELSRLEEGALAELTSRLSRVPGCAAIPLSSLWCERPDAQGNVVFHLGAGDNWFVLEPERARRVEAMMRGASPRDVG